MPLEYRLEPPFILWISKGDIEYEEGIRVSLESLVAARKTGRTRWHIIGDLLESTENRSEQDIRGIADMLLANLDILSGRLGIVVKAPLQFGVSRMLQAYTDGQGVEICLFPSEDDARSWLVQEKVKE